MKTSIGPSMNPLLNAAIMLNWTIALCCSLLVWAGSLRAQTYDFQNFTVEEGLSQSQVLCLYQVNTGELWMGTNQGGINKYNGSSFRYLTKENGLSDNVVYSIVQQRSGRILVGTNNGLNLIIGDSIRSLNVEHGLPHRGVVSLLIAENGTVWLGTGKGVAQLVGDSIIPFTADSLLSNSTVINIREGSNGSVWFCTARNGLFSWDGTEMFNISTKDGLRHNYVYDVMPFGRHDAWIFTHSGWYHLKNREVEDITREAGVPTNTIFYGYLRDRAKNVWIGTSAGVLKFKDRKLQTRLTTENGLVHNNIWKLMQDREGNLWFGSKSIGASKLNSERFKIYQSDKFVPNKTVNAVFRDKAGWFWIGTKEGLAIWHQDSVRFIGIDDGLSSAIVRDIDQTDDGSLIVATNYGITVLGPNGTRSYTSAERALNSIHDVYVDGADIWLGTNIGPALFKDSVFVQPANASEFTMPVFDAVRKGDVVWFAYDDGVLRYDGKQFKQLTEKDGFFNGRTRSVVLGPDGNLWFGTNNGIYRYDGRTCMNFGVQDGLISDAVYALGFDHQGNLWAGQSKGVAKLRFYENELEDVIRYQKEQGFMGLECSTNSIWIDEDDKIWVGTTNGLVEYDPTQDKGAYFEPLTRITAVQLFSQETDWSLFSDSVKKDGVPIDPVLPYNKNHLTFEYTGVSLTSPVSINYSYILEGLDEDWSPVTNNNRAVYPNIPPGSYTFKVRAGFGDELWQNQPVSFHFTVRPPFYRTNWFYVLLCIIGAAMLYSYYTIRRTNTKITLQKQQIEQQKNVIEKKNREMVDSINYASTIQSATLPSTEQWHAVLPESFVLFRPKDIVSGDFYWLAQSGDDILFAAVDCTGHGVPGALMSIVGYNGLNQAVKEQKLTRPARILDHLSKSVNESLRKAERDNYVKDGMDIALCRLNYSEMTLEFASAYNPLLLVRNGEEILIKGDRIAIGSLDTERRPFQNHRIKLEKGDCIYIYSDGYADQFGGPLGKKMKTPVMRRKIVELSPLPMAVQKQELERFLLEWQGSQMQVDDICVIGVRV